MPAPFGYIAASLTTSLSARVRGAVGNAALLGGVALLALTAWVVCIAGLIAVLLPLWGAALTVLFVLMLLVIAAMVALAVLRRRVRLQQARAAQRQAETLRSSRMALIAAVPGLVRNRPGATLIAAGLVIGALIVAGLKEGNKP
jgi:ABC-type bacteriocin/lantibiotic exporter with double-glycine peptidase domain